MKNTIGVRFKEIGKSLYCYVSYKKKTNRFKYYLQDCKNIDDEIQHVERCIRYLERIEKDNLENKGFSAITSSLGFPLSRSYGFGPNYFFGDVLTYNQYYTLDQYSQVNELLNLNEWFPKLDAFLNTTNVPLNELREIKLDKIKLLDLLDDDSILHLSLLIHLYFFEKENDTRLVDWYYDTDLTTKKFKNYVLKQSKRTLKNLSYKILPGSKVESEISWFIDSELESLSSALV